MSLPEHQKARRDQIVRVALASLDSAEYEKIQMRDVAEGAGVALGTLYRHFRSKEHLYAAVLVEWGRSFLIPSGRKGTPLRSDAERLKAVLGRSIRAFERTPQLLRVQLVIEASKDEHARQVFNEFGRHNVDTFLAALEKPGMSESDLEAVRAIVRTTSVVAGHFLKAWAMERCTIDEVYAHSFRAVDLIFSPPPFTDPLA